MHVDQRLLTIIVPDDLLHIQETASYDIFNFQRFFN